MCQTTTKRCSVSHQITQSAWFTYTSRGANTTLNTSTTTNRLWPHLIQKRRTPNHFRNKALTKHYFWRMYRHIYILIALMTGLGVYSPSIMYLCTRLPVHISISQPSWLPYRQLFRHFSKKWRTRQNDNTL